MTKNNKPLVSVLMTVYNREKYIVQAIESVINSTYQNWELIIVDDQSTDSSIEFARKYEQDDDRISIYINNVNLGDYPNRNKAASYAKGKYIKYLDSDDVMYRYCLTEMVHAMEKNPMAAFGVCSFQQDVDLIYPYMVSPKEAYSIEYLHKKPFLHIGPSFSIIRTDAFREFNGFLDVRHYGDSNMWLRLAQKYPVVRLNQNLIWYRISGNQEGSKRVAKPQVKIKELNSEIELLTNKFCPLDNNQINEVVEKLKFDKGNHCITVLKAFPINIFLDVKREANLSFSYLIKILTKKIYAKIIK